MRVCPLSRPAEEAKSVIASFSPRPQQAERLNQIIIIILIFLLISRNLKLSVSELLIVRIT